ncbi:dUTP pyrophosphatase [Capronia epimyces CBS 606.96]|uniref:Deoxyuridine 5'-triphosphate nucleotidohydrolase n=1 Tax=Capronia epimyces CBS 606.96 TaxID=1182542 RepID=W9XYH0_9EURO|nr:dUTP pyrophosphatase [Capronia epimyces CBS 606.96]EXJ82395.1 dUTP pyrophosphatase [Capronia epimyces CBS 606.96]
MTAAPTSTDPSTSTPLAKHNTEHHRAPSQPTSPAAKRLKSDNSSPAPTKMTDSTTTPAVAKISTQPPLLIKKLSADATTPTRGSAFAAGYDLYASKPTTIPARGKVLVSTDLAIATPEGTYGRVAPRSGLASKHFIDTGAGVIDADYRGEVKVLLFNHSDVDFAVNKGDRIAQLVLERIYTPDIVEVDSLEESVRGAGGFGSTG